MISFLRRLRAVPVALGLYLALTSCASSQSASEVPPVPSPPAVNGFDDLKEAGYLLRDLRGKPVRTVLGAERVPVEPSEAVVSVYSYYFHASNLPAAMLEKLQMPEPERRRRTTEAMRDSAGVFQRIEAGLSKPIEHPLAETNLSPLPNYINLRDLARWLLVKSRWDRENGRPGAALNDLTEELNMSAAIAHGAPLIGWLVFVTNLRMGFQETASVLPDLRSDELATLTRALEDMESHWTDAAQALAVERDLTKRMFLHLREHPKEFDGPPYSQNPEGFRIRAIGAYEVHFRFGSLLRDADGVHNAFIAMCRLPYTRRAQAAEYHPDTYLNRLAVPNGRKVCEKQDEHRAALRLLMLTAAAERIHRLTGKYPETLEALRAAEPSLPSDAATDPFTGRSLFYEVTNGKLLVYSAGPDGKDDGGTPLKRPIEGATGDYTLETLGPSPLTPPPGDS